jgi:DNA-binding response OmpR family regulator
MHTILLLEDDPTLSATLVDILELEGFEVELVTRGNEAIDKTYDNRYDLYLFDVNVPDISGFELLEALRNAQDNTPAIFITALSDINSVSKGFDAGADDYIKKPFDIDELVIRIQSKIKAQTQTIYYKDISYDPVNKTVKKNNKIIDLGEVLIEIFILLMTHQDQTVDKVQFYDVMENPSDKALRVHITKLKKLLSLEIINVRGVGYRLEKL